jgi:uncharacterized protein (TIGR02594 family)
VGNFFKKVWRGIKKVFKKVRTWIKKNWRAIVVVVVAVVASVLTYGAATAWFSTGISFWGTVGFGAVSGAGIAASQAAIAGGTWSDILRAGVTGAVTGAITAAIGYGVLHGLGESAQAAWAAKDYVSAVGYHGLQSAGHGVVGGGLSELTGGNFKDGFIGGAAGAFLSPVSGYLNKNLGFGTAGSGAGWQYLGRTATSAVVGGTVTAISGGKFGNGAATAAFMHLVNSEATEAVRRYGTFRAIAKARAPWMARALERDGLAEVHGGGSNTDIRDIQGGTAAGREWFTNDGEPSDGGSNAWCAAFCSESISSAGLSIPSSYDAIRAKSYSSWGTEASGPGLGVVTVISGGGGYHVGFGAGVARIGGVNYVALYGGNQGDSVNITLYPQSWVKAYRIPTGVNPASVLSYRFPRTNRLGQSWLRGVPVAGRTR